MSYISATQAKQIAQKAVDNLKDGTLVPKLAENLTPYAEDSGTTQTQPFFLEGSATGNGESRVDAKQVPAYAFLQEKRGNMVCVNQKLTNPDFATDGANWSAYFFGGVTSWDNGILTIRRTGGTCDISQAFQTPIPAGHTLLFIARLKTNNSNAIFFGGSNSFSSPIFQSKTNFDTYFYVGTLSNVLQRMYLACKEIDSTTETVMDVDYIRCIDLTQWFNGNIPAYIISHPEAFGRYYKGSLAAYEPGRLESATGRYLTSVGRNIWDEEWESGTIAPDGTTADSTNRIRSKNFIMVIPNERYYIYSGAVNFHAFFYDRNKNYLGDGFPNSLHLITAQQNCFYIKFVVGNSSSPVTTYDYNITISHYYEGESGYDQSYPHKVLANIDTGTEQLGAFDYKVPSGLITRATVGIDLGTLNFAYNESAKRFVITVNAMSRTAYNVINIFCSAYTYSTDVYSHDSGTGIVDAKGICTSLSSLMVRDDSYTDAAAFKAAMSGVILYYELAEPTTEQGTPFQETVPIDDFGQLSWSNTDVPQGNQIFYPVDYKAYEDTLIKYTDGDATSLVRKTDYASTSEAGAVRINTAYGLGINSGNGNVYVNYAVSDTLKAGTQTYTPITPRFQHQSVFYALSKAAGADLASSTEETAPDGTNPGVYPDAAKTAIQNMLGITDLIGNINTVLDSVNGVVI